LDFDDLVTSDDVFGLKENKKKRDLKTTSLFESTLHLNVTASHTTQKQQPSIHQKDSLFGGDDDSVDDLFSSLKTISCILKQLRTSAE
jgi:hypothetical protein